MNGASSPSQTSDKIAALLVEKNIRTFVIIDDAYDPLQAGEIPPGEVESFWNKLEFDFPEVLQELITLIDQELKITLSHADDISDEVLDYLWRHQQDLKDLKVHVEALFFRKLDKLAELNRFCVPIEERFAIEIRRRGRIYDIEEDFKGTSVVLIDYRMGPDNQESSIAKANEIASEINKRYAGPNLPLIILMSSQRVAELDKEEFRKKSDLLNGMFLFIPKEDLGDPSKLFIILGNCARTLGTGSELATFINALKKTIHTAAKQFIEDVKDLSLGDYAYIQKFSLQDDGHPLGDYMLWLFSAYLGKLVFESPAAVQKRQRVVDKLIFERLPPSQTMPSSRLIEMYESALFDANVGDVTKHPWDSKKDLAKPEQVERAEIAPYLHLGHIFARDETNDVLMVINADCDLAHAPGGKRVCDLNGSVMVVPGQLQALNKGEMKPNQIRTEFFKYKNKHYRIFWDVKRGRTYRFGEIINRLGLYGYKLEARLRLPYALEVQRAYAANLTRIGMPVAPPIYQPVRVQILGRGEGKTTQSLLDPQDELAFLISIKNPDKIEKHDTLCFFTIEFAYKLKDVLTILVNELKTRVGELDKSDEKYEIKLNRINKRIEKIDAFFISFDEWFLNLDFCMLPAEGKVANIENEAIGICRNRNHREEYNVDQLVLVNIIDM